MCTLVEVLAGGGMGMGMGMAMRKSKGSSLESMAVQPQPQPPRERYAGTAMRATPVTGGSEGGELAVAAWSLRWRW